MTTIEKMKLALGQVTNYENKAEYLENDLMTDEDFQFDLENDNIRDITQMTGKLDKNGNMAYKELTIENMYEMLADEVDGSMFADNDIEDIFEEEPEEWEIILAYTTSYHVFTVDGRMYVSML